MTTVVVLGSGIMATALTYPLRQNGHEVRLVGTHLDRDIIESIRTTGRHPDLDLVVEEGIAAYQLEEAEQAFDGADVVMSGVNSFGVDWVGEQLARLLRPGQTVLSVTKGMLADDDGNLEMIPDALKRIVGEELAGQVDWAAIVGPSIAGELAVGHDTAVVFCGDKEDVVERLADMFRTDYYHVWTSTDFLGAEIGAATKNIYAFAAGFGEGLQRAEGDDANDRYRRLNLTAAIFAQGAQEMHRFYEILGGDPKMVWGLPGVGDMHVTSAGGRNVKAGTYVGSGVPFSEVRDSLMKGVTLEGVNAIRVVGAAIEKQIDRGVLEAHEFPLLRHLHGIIARDEPISLPWDEFFGGRS
ncbi:NAD(P)H-dependent glycerol-3-phosphate dehydrogenase [Georgenia sp. Z1491]|uniref:NAD(P)H-dependent glycerol-3-phosphate dehydrogenase n=1 Tax=Georgenia sp. Z1491 TaxID=3416707 RepID=UPI003CF3A346